jgi:hypothetical protein
MSLPDTLFIRLLHVHDGVFLTLQVAIFARVGLDLGHLFLLDLVETLFFDHLAPEMSRKRDLGTAGEGSSEGSAFESHGRYLYEETRRGDE